MSKEYTDEELLRSVEFHTSERRTICEVFREIYDIIYEQTSIDNKEHLIELIIEGFKYGKKMNTRMVQQYKELVKLKNVPDGEEHNLVFKELNTNTEQSRALRTERRIKRFGA